MNFFSLPHRLWWSHHLAFLLHDQLAETLVRGEEVELFLIRFPLVDDAERKSLENIDDGHVLEWLQKSGRTDEAKQVLERTLVHGLLSDMCQFLFESIECAAKGKVGVAFALLRKPLRDQLFMLEWILADRDDFLAAFSKGPEAVDLCDLLKKRPDWMKSITTSALSHSAYSELGDGIFLWESRFDKAVHWSLEGDWSRALHLVTTNRHYRTEVENLNLTFIDVEDRAALQERFYQIVPGLLCHLCGVVRAITERWDPEFISMGRFFNLRLVANLELSAREHATEAIEPFGVDAINEFLRELCIECLECKQPLQLAGTRDLERFVIDLLVRCNQCGFLDAQLELINDVDGTDDESESNANDLVE
ncbi:MAG: hypothetical protein C0478_03205 [Planctomyces sp.]|nr:hypothetical protein [Planctomyces sp.]